MAVQLLFTVYVTADCVLDSAVIHIQTNRS